MDKQKQCMTLPEANNNFRKYFPGLNFNDFIAGELTLIYGSPKINLIKLDDYLYEKHQDYDREELCLAEVLIKHYGNEAKAFIEKLL